MFHVLYIALFSFTDMRTDFVHTSFSNNVTRTRGILDSIIYNIVFMNTLQHTVKSLI